MDWCLAWVVGYYTSEKGYDRVPWCLVFLRTALPSFCAQIKSWFKWKVWPLMASVSPAYSILGTMCLPGTLFESCWTPKHLGFTKICAHGALRCYMQIARKGTHAYCAYLLCSFTCSMVPVNGRNWVLTTTEIVTVWIWPSDFYGCCVFEEMNQGWVHAQPVLTIIFPSMFLL